MAKKIGEILLEKGLLTPDVVTQGLNAQKFHGGRVGSIWLEMGVIEERDLLAALCEQKHAQPVKAGQLKSVTKSTIDLIPSKVAVRYQAIPLARDNRRLTVAISDPNDLLALDELAFITGCVIEPLLATERTILSALETFYGWQPKKRETLTVGGLREATAAAVKEARKAPAPAPRAPASPTPPEATQDLMLDDAARAEAEKARAFWAAQGEKAAAAAGRSATGAAAPAAPTPGGATTEVADGNALLVDDGDSTVIVADVPRTLEEASRRLARVEIRDDIADVLLWCTEELFARSALFIFQKSRTLGWTGQGRGLAPNDVRKVVMPVEEISIFTIARDSRSHYLGALPKNAGNEKLVAALGGEWPPAVLVIPFGVKGRPIGCFFAEDTPEELGAVDLPLMFRLLQKAGLALELLLIRSKIVMI